MEIFYEDIMENFENKNLREKLMQLVNDYKIIIIKGLNSSQRHTIYRQMYYPLKFEKIVLNENDEENKDIRIYNCKIKQKVNKKNDKNETNKEKTKETKNEDEYVFEDSENSEQEEQEEQEGNDSDFKYESETDDSYFTDEDEQLTKIEDIVSQILEKLVNNRKKIDGNKRRINFLILFNIIGWIVLYTLDPVRLIKTKIIECEAF